MKTIDRGYASNTLLLINCVMAFIYLSWWFDLSHIGNKYLYILLFIGEIYHVFMALGFWFTVWNRKKDTDLTKQDENNILTIDVFITVAGEPISIVEETAKAALKMRYKNYKVYILNDGYVANKPNWKDFEILAKKLNIICITRTTGGGAKAGNINNALNQTTGDIVAILDADMVPHVDFLAKLVPYFSDEKIAFAQSPQFYKNYSKNEVTKGSWEQQNFFFGPIMDGKNTMNAAFICGTNVLIRRKALLQVGGINEKSIAEDVLTSFYLHKNKWKSVYYPNVLCEGLAPEDLLSYYKQQYRWARGSIEIMFRYNPFLRLGFSFSQRFQYLLSALYYINGIIVLIDIIIPLLFLYFGLQPVNASTQSFALYFIPYIFLNLYTIYLVSKGNITFRAISFSQSSFLLQSRAIISLLTGSKTKFDVTPKQQQQGNFTYLSYPHLLYIALAIVGIIINFHNFGSNPAVTSNTAWAIFNIILFIPFIKASLSKEKSTI